MLARVKTIPGVVDAAESSALPPYNGADSKIEILGKSHQDEWHAVLQNISEGYFRVLRIPFKTGRGFSEAEINDVRKLAGVNETFGSTYFRGENPLGQRGKLGSVETLRGLGSDRACGIDRVG